VHAICYSFLYHMYHCQYIYIDIHHIYTPYICIPYIYTYVYHTYIAYIYTHIVICIYIIYITPNRRQKGKTLQLAQLRAYRPRRHPIREGPNSCPDGLKEQSGKICGKSMESPIFSGKIQ
jgi:hypothetical protein